MRERGEFVWLWWEAADCCQRGMFLFVDNGFDFDWPRRMCNVRIQAVRVPYNFPRRVQASPAPDLAGLIWIPSCSVPNYQQTCVKTKGVSFGPDSSCTNAINY